MKLLFNGILVIVRLYIFFRVSYLLFMSYFNPTEYPIENLTWWVYFLVFEIWCTVIFSKIDKIYNEE